jgi:hypothetical protein
MHVKRIADEREACIVRSAYLAQIGLVDGMTVGLHPVAYNLLVYPRKLKKPPSSG